MPADSPDEQNETLHRLAEALDVSPKAFSEPTVSNLHETIELLRLWSTLTDGQARAKVLAYVRTVAPRV